MLISIPLYFLFFSALFVYLFCALQFLNKSDGFEYFQFVQPFIWAKTKQNFDG